MKRRNLMLSAAATLVAGTLAGGVHAQAWPGKPVKMLVASSPGSAPDQIARIVGDRLSHALGQPVIVENKPGAGGIIAVNALRQAPSDGLTIMMLHAAVATTTPFLYKEASYDMVRDFDVIGTIAVTPMMIVANPAFPANNLAEAIAAAKAKPDQVALASSVRGSIPNLTNELLATRTGAKFQVVPFSSSGQGVQATVGNQVPLFTDGVAAVIQLVRAGRLKALAAASETVLPGLEGIPLAKDTVPGFNVYGWFAMAAPKGTPNEVVERLNHEINTIVGQPTVVEQFAKLGTYPRPGSVQSARQYIQSEITVFGNIIKTAGIKAE